MSTDAYSALGTNDNGRVIQNTTENTLYNILWQIRNYNFLVQKYDTFLDLICTGHTNDHALPNFQIKLFLHEPVETTTILHSCQHGLKKMRDVLLRRRIDVFLNQK